MAAGVRTKAHGTSSCLRVFPSETSAILSPVPGGADIGVYVGASGARTKKAREIRERVISFGSCNLLRIHVRAGHGASLRRLFHAFKPMCVPHAVEPGSDKLQLARGEMAAGERRDEGTTTNRELKRRAVL